MKVNPEEIRSAAVVSPIITLVLSSCTLSGFTGTPAMDVQSIKIKDVKNIEAITAFVEAYE